MRMSMLLAGFGVIAWGLFIGYALGYPSWITDTLGLFNILVGIITPRSRKVELQPEPSGAVKLVVDKVMFRHGKWRFSDYELVFLDNRLVMKKLFSWKPIVILGGFFGGVGGLIGGVTGFSVQEFLDQRKRDKIRARNEFMTVARGDMEVPYDSMSQVRLTGIDLRMVVRGRLLVFSMGAEYPPLMARRVRNLIPNECWVLPPLH